MKVVRKTMPPSCRIWKDEEWPSTLRGILRTSVPESGHDSWTETYNNPGLYEWRLKHERGK